MENKRNFSTFQYFQEQGFSFTREAGIRNRALSYLKRGGSINNQIYPIVKIIRDGRFTFFATTVNRLVESFKV